MTATVTTLWLFVKNVVFKEPGADDDIRKNAFEFLFPDQPAELRPSADQLEQMVSSITEFASMTKLLLVTKSNGRSCTGRTMPCDKATRKHGCNEALAASLRSNFEK